MTIEFYDTHCHLDFSAFDVDRNAVIKRAHDAKIARIMVPGTQTRTFAKQVELAMEHAPSLLNAFGLHPYFIDTHQRQHITDVEAYLERYPNAPVGEIGLDTTCSNHSLQKEIFDEHVRLAIEWQRPMILHHRNTLDELYKGVKDIRHRLPEYPGVIHAFSGSKEQALAWARLGFKLGVGGSITYSRARKTRAAIAAAPLESLVLETDAPDMPMAGFQGQRNEPAQLIRVWDSLLELRKEQWEELQVAIWENSTKVFWVDANVSD